MADTPVGSQDNLNNLGYGTLNDVTKPIGGNRERQSGQESFMDAVANSAQNQFDINAIDNTGPYKAVVLRIDSPGGANPAAQAGSWLAAAGLPMSPPLVRVKARIPEIHAALPIPDGRGDVAGEHQKIIDMYPTYVAQTTDIIAPAIGDIVYVDYGNKNKWTDPILIQNLIGNKGAAGGGAGGGSSSGCFKSSVGGGGLLSPSGDSLPGANKAAAATGLPLLERKPLDVELGEYKFIKGEEGGYLTTGASWEKAIKAVKLPGKVWLGYLEGNDTAWVGGGDSEHKSEDEVRDTIIFVPNVTDVSFKEAEVELIVYLHDFNEYDVQSFTEIADAAKKMAVGGRNFILVMPELPWSSNTNTPNGRTDQGLDDYNEWWDLVLETLTEITGAKFEDGSSNLFVSVIAKGAGNYVIRNASDSDEFHGTCWPDGSTCAYPAQRMIMSIPKGTISGDDFNELIDEWAEEIEPDITECIFVCNSTIVPEIQAEVQDLKENAVNKGRPFNVILQEFDDSTTITAASILTWINFDKAKYKEEKEIAAHKEAEATPTTDDVAENADNTGNAAAAAAAADPVVGPLPPEQPDAQGPPPPDPATPPSETPKMSATDPKEAPNISAAVPYEENRVKVKDLGGSLVGAAADALLVKIPESWTTGDKTRKLHKLAMARTQAIHDTAKEAGIELFVASAWREHKWESYESYKAKVTAEYGTFAEGKKMRAFSSAHETGLAVDWGKPSGLEPESSTISAQKKTKAFAWLKENAHFFGLTPYKNEPWHWEIKITKEAYITGEEFAVGNPPSYAVRVDSLGSSDAQLPSGPSSGGTGGGGSAQKCRKRSGGGGGGGGGPGISFQGVGAPAKVNILAGPAMPANRHADGKGYPKRKKLLKMYIIHNTAGWPTQDGPAYVKKLTKKYYPGGDKGNSLVTYWTAQNGDIVQTAPFTSKCWSGAPCNSVSQGNEIGNMVRLGSTRMSDSVKKNGNLLVRQDHKGHVQVLPGYEGGGTYRGDSDEAFMMDSQAQVEAVWNHYVWISSGADGMEGSDLINMPIAFPGVISDDYYWWGRMPEGSNNSGAGAWWKATTGEDSFAGGIVAHHRWHHGDGEFGEYYCLGRAKGLNPDDAYYATVGALCSMAGQGKNHTGFGKKATRHPDSEYIQMGRDIMKGAPLTAAWGSLAEEPTWF